MNQRQHSGNRWLLVIAALALGSSGLAVLSSAALLSGIALAVDCCAVLALCALSARRGGGGKPDAGRDQWSEQQLRLLASSPAIIYRTEVNDDFRPTFISPNVSEVIGYTAEQVLASPSFWLDHLHQDDRPRVVEQCKALPEKGNLMLEYRVRNALDEFVWIHDHARLIRDTAGRPVEVIGSWSDISDRKRTELALEQARDEALQAAKAKSEFLANTSHEIRTPLNGMLGMLDLLADSDLEPSQREFVDTARNSGAALLRIINDILDVEKIESGRLEIECIDIDIVGLIEDLAAVFAEAADEKGLKLSCDVDAEIEHGVRGDPTRLRQILGNLLSNAIKFTDSGEVMLRLQKLHEDGSRIALRFEVEDTGIGVDAEIQDRLFSPFTQADSSTTRRYGGTGLGLTICRQLVELLGGDIGLASRPGQGALFWVVLELPKGAAKGAAVAEHRSRVVDRQPAATAVARGSRGRVLVVEDNTVNQKVAAELLRKLGVEVGLAHNGQDALEALDRQPWDLIFMDWQMPVMDGLEATRAVRRREQQQGRAHVPIIAMTANAMTGDRETCLAVGMDDYLRKPVKREELRVALERWLPGVAAEDQASAPPVAPERRPGRAVDRAAVETLKELMGKEFSGLAQSFIRESRVQLARQQEGLKDGDMGRVRIAAHTLKSSGANMGASAVSALARAIERAAQQGEAVEIDSLLSKLEAELGDFQQFLEAETRDARPDIGALGAG